MPAVALSQATAQHGRPLDAFQALQRSELSTCWVSAAALPLAIKLFCLASTIRWSVHKHKHQNGACHVLGIRSRVCPQMLVACRHIDAYG